MSKMNNFSPQRLTETLWEVGRSSEAVLTPRPDQSQSSLGTTRSGSADPTRSLLTKSPNVCKLGICPQEGNPALTHSAQDVQSAGPARPWGGV